MGTLNDKKNVRIKTPDIVKRHNNIDLADGRVNEIYHAFRFLDQDSPHYSKILILPACEFEIKEITAIVGPSGSGKSLLLKEVEKLLPSSKRLTFDFDLNKPLINLIGKSTKQAIQILTLVGLGEGNLFLRKFSELSDGQKFRALLAVNIYNLSLNNHDTYLIIDEFCSNLDLKTAIGLAITISKVPTVFSGIHLILACNNEKITESLHYSTLIKLGLDHTIDIEYQKFNKGLHRRDIDVRILKTSLEEYNKFKKFHYLQINKKFDELKVVVARFDGDDVGCAIFSNPIRDSVVKNNKFFEKINKSIINGYRVVVHPDFRGCGIAKKLVIEGAKLHKVLLVEISSSMFHYNPVPAFWGFKNVNTIYDDYYNAHRSSNIKLRKYILKHGFSSIDFYNFNRIEQIIYSLDKTILKQLAFEDMLERANSLLYYYVNLMALIDEYPNCEYSKLLSDFTTDIVMDIDDKELGMIIHHNEQPLYSAFCQILEGDKKQ
jgi:ABC-type lipoprotein export system ATPase subunit/GNAT superfamily N-acetyltransferase